jgi:hypothetical protein
MELITSRGDLVAVAGATRAHLAPEIAVLADEHPVKQFVFELCLYAHRLSRGALASEPPGYLPGRAEHYVREQRMPAELFRMGAHLSDEELAEAFNVPVWEVATRRRELETMTRAGPPLARRRPTARSRRRAGLCVRERPRASG